jgi:chaperonin GroES
VRPEPTKRNDNEQEPTRRLTPNAGKATAARPKRARGEHERADRLIVEVLEEEESTESGIVLPDTAKEKPQRGRVLAVGPGARDKAGKRIQIDVAEGDEVIFSKYGGTEIKVGSDEVLILRESDVLAKVTPRASKRKRSLAGATA